MNTGAPRPLAAPSSAAGHRASPAAAAAPAPSATLALNAHPAAEANAQGLSAPARWADALTALQLLALPPQRLGGIWLRAPHGPLREAWLQALAAQSLPVLRAPASVDTARWLGGLDLAATLHTGRLCEQPGLLAQAHGGLLCLPMAERWPQALTATLAQTLDRGGVDRGAGWRESRFAVVALDESLDDEAPLASALQERLGLWIDLRDLPPALMHSVRPATACDGAPAPEVVVGAHALQALCATALALGIDSLRAPQLALAVAQAHAQLHRRDHLAEEDLAYACRTVLGPRARQWPTEAGAPEEALPEEKAPEETAPDSDPVPDSPPEAPENQERSEASPPPDVSEVQALEALMVAAAAARLPPELLQRLSMGAAPARSAQASGTSGQRSSGRTRGRPLPPRPGRPGSGARLHVLATLRAAAPRQRLRGRSSPAQTLRIRAEDFHVHRYQQHHPSCLILALDASGSAALHRLAEAKGAVQNLLEQSYARRDSVCVIGFRGAQAQLLLPTTRSLVRARRALSGLPGGGGTPLASALQLAHAQAQQLQRQGITPILVVLSDGRANVTLEGLGGRALAQEQAQHWARTWQASGHAALWIDTAAQPEALAQQLAQQLGARYLPMPQLQSQRLASALHEAQGPR